MNIRRRVGTNEAATGAVEGPPHKLLDRVLLRWRIAKAARHIPRDARILDVGSRDGALFRYLGGRMSWGLGIDPALRRSVCSNRFELIAGRFPDDVPDLEPFDVITMLAVIEHIPTNQHQDIAAACIRLLRPGGLLIMTAPSPRVDLILESLARLRVIAGMALHEHHGFDPKEIPQRFSTGGLSLVTSRRFELGLNNLFVFHRRHV